MDQVDDVRDFLSKELKPWKDEHVAANVDVKNHVTNPLNAYLLIKRNVYNVKLIQEKLFSFDEDLRNKIGNLDKKLDVKEEEVAGAVAGIIRAQKAYHLKSEDLVDGIIDGVKTRKPLSPYDVYVFGLKASKIDREEFFATEYLKIALENNKIEEDRRNDIDENEIKKNLLEIPKNIIDPYNESSNMYGTKEGRTFLVQKTCRGNLTRSTKETKNLRCRFASFSSFSIIAPFKLEEASVEPYIVLCHGILSEAEIDNLLDMSKIIQEKATVGLGKVTVVDNFRLAQVSWLKKYDDELIKRLNLRFEDMTGLAMKSAELLQVQNYGIGGHYYGHYDYEATNTDPMANVRMATLMLYVSDFETFNVIVW